MSEKMRIAARLECDEETQNVPLEPLQAAQALLRQRAARPHCSVAQHKGRRVRDCCGTATMREYTQSSGALYGPERTHAERQLLNSSFETVKTLRDSGEVGRDIGREEGRELLRQGNKGGYCARSKQRH